MSGRESHGFGRRFGGPNMATVQSFINALPQNARTASPNAPFRYFANDEGYAGVFAQAISAYEQQPQGLGGPRLALVDAPGFIPSTLPEIPGDITLVTPMQPRLTGWMQEVMNAVKDEPTPDRCIDRLLARDETGHIRTQLEQEQAILEDIHFTSSLRRYELCKRAVKNKPTVLHTMDIAAPYNALGLAHACGFIDATLVFANVSDRGDTEAFHVQNVLNKLSGSATALIIRSSIASRARGGFQMPTNRKAPRASLCRGAADYGQKALADSSSIF